MTFYDVIALIFMMVGSVCFGWWTGSVAAGIWMFMLFSVLDGRH